MKFLVTGGLGFVGSNLAAKLIELNSDPFIFDNMSRTGCGANHLWLKSKGNFNFIRGDIRSTSNIETIIRDIKPDVIFHLAGQVALTCSIEEPKHDFEVNALGTLNVLEAVRKYSPRSIVCFSSTNKVYGDLAGIKYRELASRYEAIDYPDGFDESLRLDFSGPYGCSKGTADQYVVNYSRVYGIRTIVFRHSTIFGLRQFSTFDQGWVGWFAREAISKSKTNSIEPISVAGNGKQVRDILFSSDLVSCYFSALDNISKTSGKVYNIGGGKSNSLSIIELLEILSEQLKIKFNVKLSNPRPFDQKIFISDFSAAKNDFAWEPKVSKFEGIEQVTSWLRDQSFE